MDDREGWGKQYDGVTGKIILEVAYKPYLPYLLDDHPLRVFMQANARTHTIPETMAWFAEKEYTIMKWPPYSPDLNPIEMVWKRIKNTVAIKHPELATMKDSDNSIKDAIVEAVIEAWEVLDEEWLWRLNISMPDRVRAVLKAHGGYTRYQTTTCPLVYTKPPRIGGDMNFFWCHGRPQNWGGNRAD